MLRFRDAHGKIGEYGLKLGDQHLVVWGSTGGSGEDALSATANAMTEIRKLAHAYGLASQGGCDSLYWCDLRNASLVTLELVHRRTANHS